MDIPARGGDALFELQQQIGKARQRGGAYRAALFSQLLERHRRRGHCGSAFDLKTVLQMGERLLQPWITQRRSCGFGKFRPLCGHRESPPIGGVPAARPARISAAWRNAMRSPLRAARPARCSKQPRSPASTRDAQLAFASAILSSAMRAEISGYFTEKRPPKPQQTSL